MAMTGEMGATSVARSLGELHAVFFVLTAVNNKVFGTGLDCGLTILVIQTGEVGVGVPHRTVDTD